MRIRVKGDQRMKVLKKIGWFLVAMLPALLLVVIMLASNMIATSILKEVAFNTYLENPLWGVVTYQLIALPVFGLWYYFAYGRKKRPQNVERPTGKNILVIVFAGVVLQILIGGILPWMQYVFPELMQSYADLIESSKFTKTMWLSLLTTVILAPLVEESMCRGIAFRIAGKVSERFWVVNCIQALAFGIMHMNLVQGSYAFFLGLALGYIYGKYRNIWICMLLHGAFNLSGNYMDHFFQIFQIFPEQIQAAISICLMAISAVLLGYCYKSLGRIAPLREESEGV